MVGSVAARGIPCVALLVVVGRELAVAYLCSGTPLGVVATLARALVERLVEEHLSGAEVVVGNLFVGINGAEGESHGAVVVAVDAGDGFVQQARSVGVGAVHLGVRPRCVGQRVVAFVGVGVALDVDAAYIGIFLAIHTVKIVSAYIRVVGADNMTVLMDGAFDVAHSRPVDPVAEPHLRVELYVGDEQSVAVESTVPLCGLPVLEHVVLLAVVLLARFVDVSDVAIAVVIYNIGIAAFGQCLHVVDGDVFRQLDGFLPTDIAQFVSSQRSRKEGIGIVRALVHQVPCPHAVEQAVACVVHVGQP